MILTPVLQDIVSALEGIAPQVLETLATDAAAEIKKLVANATDLASLGQFFTTLTAALSSASAPASAAAAPDQPEAKIDPATGPLAGT